MKSSVLARGAFGAARCFDLPRGWAAAAAVVLTLLVAPAWAQSDAFVITGSREPLARHQVAADVVVIDSERIRASGADSIEELLRREAGVQLLRNGGPGQSAGLSIRGAARGQTLLLIDGVRVGSASLGTPELDTLTLAGVERIEVLRGPGSSLYGADAIGGVVQIITRRAGTQPTAGARVAVGGYGAREGALSVETRAGAFDLAAALSHERQRGTTAVRPGDPFVYNPDADGFERQAAWAQLGFTPEAGHRIGLMLRGGRLNNQYDSADFLPPTFAPDASGDFRNRVRDEVAALDYRGTVAAAWTLGARLAAESTRSVSGASELSRYATRREQGSAQASRRLPNEGQLSLALEQIEETASSTAYAADASRRNRAAVLAYAGALPGVAAAASPGAGLALQAEVREDRNSVYGAHTTGRLGLRGAVVEALAWRALVGTSFRAPSFNDLVFPGFGVATVRPEKGRSAELGLQWQPGAAADIGLTLYRQDLRDLIGFQPDPARCPPGYFGCASNVQAARLQGASLDGAWRADEGASLSGRIEWLDATDRSTGQPLPRRAEWQAHLQASHRIGALRLGAEVLYVGERPDPVVMLPAYTTLDLLATWRLARGIELQAKLLNATDRDIEPLRGYQALGRQAWLVLRFAGVF